MSVCVCDGEEARDVHLFIFVSPPVRPSCHCSSLSSRNCNEAERINSDAMRMQERKYRKRSEHRRRWTLRIIFKLN